MQPLDPTRIHVESHASPIWQEEPTFHETMAEQLRRAPWLGIAIVLHAVALFVLASLGTTRNRPDQRQVTLLPPAAQPVEPPPEPEPEPIKPEPVVHEPVLQDAHVDPVEDTNTESFETFSHAPKDSAFTNRLDNSALGMGGNPGGAAYGQRGTGCGGPRGGSALAPVVARALQWLVDHQDQDGKWDSDGFMKHDDPSAGAICDGAGNAVHDVGVTGLALLAFLGEGSTLRSGPYQEQIKAGVRWLRSQQDRPTGLFGHSASSDFIYDHAIATYAMVEACGLSEFRTLRPYAQRALNYLESHRNPYMVWRYQPRDNDNDTSVTGWGVMAYKSAKHFGLDVNDRALALCATWFDQVGDPLTGRHGYSKRGELSSRHPGDHASRFPTQHGEAMTAVALFCRYFMGQDPKEHEIMDTAAGLIASKPPVWDEAGGAIDHYYWYYASYALYQAGGPLWKDWSRALVEAIPPHQRADGDNVRGSWDPIGAWGEDGGRVYSTALLALTLQAHYRYTRLLR